MSEEHTSADRVRPIRIGAGLAWSGVAIVAMLAATYVVWNDLPGDARIPIHWNAKGEVDGYASKAFALLFAPAVAALVAVVSAIAPLIEPRRQNLASGRALYHAIWAGMIAIFAGVHAAIIAAAFGYPMSMPTFLMPALGLLIAVVGNALGKTRSSFTMGVRTPWTLSSDYAWEKTHRTLGRMWVIIGLAAAVSPLFLNFEKQVYLLLGGVLGSTFVAVPLSYFYWRADPSRKADGQ
jgi:uncharacterized membrane protein